MTILPIRQALPTSRDIGLLLQPATPVSLPCFTASLLLDDFTEDKVTRQNSHCQLAARPFPLSKKDRRGVEIKRQLIHADYWHTNHCQPSLVFMKDRKRNLMIGSSFYSTGTAIIFRLPGQNTCLAAILTAVRVFPQLTVMLQNIVLSFLRVQITNFSGYGL